ncbi:hypothetical protein [Cupriavidus sp. SK-4]|uniref:hypothetical protein n=1 Tax=Cupriavidus sp. SK-4 TaxID=574750 RepID=UPI0012689220|nr:hypothetical protein [Cupriavidus sp. SK-4]
MSHLVFGGLFPPNVHEPPFIREEKVSSRPIAVILRLSVGGCILTDFSQSKVDERRPAWAEVAE